MERARHPRRILSNLLLDNELIENSQNLRCEKTAKHFYTYTRVSYIVEFSAFDGPIEVVKDDDPSGLNQTPRKDGILKNIL